MAAVKALNAVNSTGGIGPVSQAISSQIAAAPKVPVSSTIKPKSNPTLYIAGAKVGSKPTASTALEVNESAPIASNVAAAVKKGATLVDTNNRTSGGALSVLSNMSTDAPQIDTPVASPLMQSAGATNTAGQGMITSGSAAPVAASPTAEKVAPMAKAADPAAASTASTVASPAATTQQNPLATMSPVAAAATLQNPLAWGSSNTMSPITQPTPAAAQPATPIGVAIPSLSGQSSSDYNNLINPNTDTVEGRINSMLSSGSPLLEKAKTQAMQAANGRGLLNSSIATEAGEQAVIDTARSIATQDAAAYNQQREGLQSMEQNAWSAYMNAIAQIQIQQIPAEDKATAMDNINAIMKGSPHVNFINTWRSIPA